MLCANEDGWLNELFRTYFNHTGKTMKHNFFGQPSYATIEKVNLKAILRDDSGSWSVAPSRVELRHLLGKGIFTQDGTAWRLSRRLLQASLAPKRFRDLEIFHGPVDTLLSVLPQVGEVDLQPLFRRLSLDIATALVFGKPIRCLRQPDAAGEQDFANAFSAAQALVLRRMRLSGLRWILGQKQLRRTCDTVHQFTDRLIENRLNNQSMIRNERKNLCLLDALATETTDRRELRDQVINLLLAARDTTASLLSWTM
jgi:cytochrome P450